MTAPAIPLVAVVDAAGASAADRDAIASGIPSRALMQRAGAATAALVAERFADRLRSGVLVVAGSGNNAGDGWVIAHALHAVGIAVRVVERGEARTGDARAERQVALEAGVTVAAAAPDSWWMGERVAVDAVLGTGFAAGSPLREPALGGVELLRSLRERGVAVVAVDIPSGMDATDGRWEDACTADLTVTFGTVKRAHLVQRERCGSVVVVDIGLGARGARPGDAHLVSPAWFRAALPAIAADAHKGTRGKVAIVGGAPGMGGAVVLAARGALRSGAGMVKCIVAPESLASVRESEAAALTSAWPADAAEADAIASWADVVLVGPGLGGENAPAIVQRVLTSFRGPVVLDADALNAFAGDAEGLRALTSGRHALLTPHPVEFGRLAGLPVERVLDERFPAPLELARRTGASVLLKGVPTIVASPDGTVRVVAEGTPILATGGSGDVLGGIAATLLAGVGDAAVAGALAAFAHGRAAAAVSARAVRGYTLDDVLTALPDVWALAPASPRPPILAELPAVGEPAR